MIIAANTSALHALEFSSSIAASTLPQEVQCRPLSDKPLDNCFPIVAE